MLFGVRCDGVYGADSERYRMSEETVNSNGEMVSASVLAPQKSRGHPPWKPGQSGNPLGRPKKRDEQAINDALNRAAGPDKIEYALNRMYELADQYNSWKAWDRYVTLALSYQLGNPTQRIQQTTAGLADVLALLNSKPSE